MKLSEIANNIESLQKEFRERIIPYWKVLTQSTEGRPVSDIAEPENIVFEDGFVVLSAEYNDACSCHPEFRDCELMLYPHDLDLTIEEFVETIRQRDEEAKKRKQRTKDEQKAAGAALDKEQELALLNQLKTKYPSKEKI